ncbi:regulator of G-protein signaling 11 isoform X5 [Canis lupus baileyi]
MNHAWDLVVVQAREQLRAAKQRRKGDRLVIACQERTYWLVNRPPPGIPSVLEQGPERSSCAAAGRAQLVRTPPADPLLPNVPLTAPCAPTPRPLLSPLASPTCCPGCKPRARSSTGRRWSAAGRRWPGPGSSPPSASRRECAGGPSPDPPSGASPPPCPGPALAPGTPPPRYLNFSSQRGPHDPFLSGCLPSNPWVTDDDTYWTVNAPSVAVPTKLRVERWGFSFQELLGDPVGRAHFLAFLGTEFSAENLSFWEACEELRYGGQAQVPALVDSVYQQFLAPGAARWVNVDSRTMESTLAGLRRPHRYVLDDAQLHIYMLMKKDSYPRFLKSAAYRDLLAVAVVPAEARRRAFPFLRKPPHPSPSPTLLPASTSAEPVTAASDPACGDRGT